MKPAAKFLPIVICLVVVGLPLFAAAQTSGPPLTSVSDVVNLFDRIQQNIAKIFWIIAVISVFYAAFLYATAGGSPEKVGKAGKQLLYAVIAIAIGLMVYGLPKLVESFLKG